jgi:hypothetical protein
VLANSCLQLAVCECFTGGGQLPYTTGIVRVISHGGGQLPTQLALRECFYMVADSCLHSSQGASVFKTTFSLACAGVFTTQFAGCEHSHMVAKAAYTARSVRAFSHGGGQLPHTLNIVRVYISQYASALIGGVQLPTARSVRVF